MLAKIKIISRYENNLYCCKLENTIRARKRFFSDYNGFWTAYKNLNIPPPEKPHLAEFEKHWQKAVILMDKLYKDIDQLNKAQTLLWETIHKMDNIVNFELQAHLTKKMGK